MTLEIAESTPKLREQGEQGRRLALGGARGLRKRGREGGERGGRIGNSFGYRDGRRL